MTAVEVLPADSALARCEAVIDEWIGGFVAVGTALAKIRDQKLYHPEYKTFEKYLAARWPTHITKGRASQLINAAQVAQKLFTMVNSMPESERQVRPLLKLPESEQQADAWQRAVDDSDGGVPTAAVVTQAVEAIQAEAAAVIPAPVLELRTQTVPAPVTTAAPTTIEIRKAPYGVADWQHLTDGERAYILREAPKQGTTQFTRTNDSVEWARWTWNPVTGCEHGCAYCYARDITQHFPDGFPLGFEAAFYPARLHAPRRMKVPRAAEEQIGERNVFVGSMADLFGKWVPQDWIDSVFAEVQRAQDWNFLFLTKFPQRLAELQWPENAWVGTTVDSQARVATAERAFAGVQAGIKWLSCEPLLERLTFKSLAMFDWVVIGSSQRSTQTPEFQPPWEWVEHLIQQARDAGCKVYLKHQLTARPREYPTEAVVLA